MNEIYGQQEVPEIAQKLLAELQMSDTFATVLCLQGDLGAGKTTLTQSLAAAIGVTDTVVSPTFVIAKFYEARNVFETLIHIDAYRIESLDELGPIGFAAMLKMPRTLIVIEWPEKISSAIPPNALWCTIIQEGDNRRISLVEKYEKN